MVEIAYFTVLLSMPFFIVGAFVFGLFVPKEYRLEFSEVFDQPKNLLWDAITNFSNYSAWLSYVSEMECEDSKENIWLQRGNINPIRFKVIEFQPFDRLELQIHNSLLPAYGGRRFTLETLDHSKTKLTLEQFGEINDLMLRTYLYLFHRKKDPVRIYLESLKNHLASSRMARQG